jgi:hypothetical protein
MRADPDRLQAWQNRDSDPETWQRTLARMTDEVGKQYPKRQEWTPTSDIEAIEAYVRGANAPADDRKRIDVSGVGNMSSAEYAQWKKETVG